MGTLIFAFVVLWIIPVPATVLLFKDVVGGTVTIGDFVWLVILGPIGFLLAVITWIRDNWNKKIL